MKFIETTLKDAFIIEPEAYEDQRGSFSRIFCENEFKEVNHLKRLVQINCAFSNDKGLVRGMHCQRPPKAEIKIVKCLRGSVFDVIVDLRRDSGTFLKWHGEKISNRNRRMVYIPEGFAHGYQTLEKNCELLYFHTEFYNPDCEETIRFDDPKVGIKWPLHVTGVSERDKKHSFLSNSYNGIVL